MLRQTRQDAIVRNGVDPTDIGRDALRSIDKRGIPQVADKTGDIAPRSGCRYPSGG